FLSALIDLFGIKEFQLKVTNVDEKQSYSRKEVLQHIFKQPVMLIVMLLSMLVQVAHFRIQPILSLYVAEIHDMLNVASYSVLAFYVAGLGHLFMSKRSVMLGDGIGHTKVMIGLLFLASVVYLPWAWVSSLWHLVILRFMVGVAIGGIIPVRLAFLTKEAPV